MSVAAGATGCDDGGDARFVVRFASDFAPSRHTVSVFGVYKGGRMSSGAWKAMGPGIAPALASPSCEVGFEALASTDAALADSLDAYARDNGPTDDLLAAVSPAAQGELILVVTLAGSPRARGSDAGAQRPPSAGPSSAGPMPGGGRMGRRGGFPASSAGSGRSAKPSGDANVLDVSAQFFSVAKRESVGVVALRYSGTSYDDAMKQFAEKLAKVLPDVACAGWRWDANVDADKVRRQLEE